MFTEFRLALRQLAKARGFTAIAIVTLALGIGLNTSMFSLMNLLLLQPLPFVDRDQLVRIYRTANQSPDGDHSADDYLALQESTRDFAQIAAFRLWGFALAHGDRPPVHLDSLRVSGDFFRVLGVSAELGRTFTAEEDRPDSGVIVLSHATWQAQFGGDPSIIGQSVRIDGHPTTVIGVMPASFSVVALWGPGAAFRPLGLTPVEKRDLNDRSLQLIARIAPGVAPTQLNARLATLAEERAQNRPIEERDQGLRAVSLQSTTSNPVIRGIVWLLFGLAGSVLLIACANLANLQLARALARAHEFAVRSALGASRRKLLRPVLIESLLLSLAGGGLGILVATWTNAWLSSRLSSNGVVTFTVELDWPVLTFALGLSLLTGILFGLVPASLLARIRAMDTLKSGTRGNTGDRTQHRLRSALIVTQFALALILLAGAGLFIRGLDRMLERDTGWNQDNILRGVINLPQTNYPTPGAAYAFYERLEERLRALPGVENVTIGWTLPIFQFISSRTFVAEAGGATAADSEHLAYVNGVTPGFLDTLKVKLLAGRGFRETDNATAPAVAIISESMARALFAGEIPIGRRIGRADASERDWLEIVGVIPDLSFAISVTSPATRYQVLRPLAQDTWNYVTVALRAPNADTLAEPMRQAIAGLDPNLPVQQLSTVTQLVRLGTGGFLMVNTILASFALLGLFLAALGLYGVIARLVVQRTPEIGVRVALGAQSNDIMTLILRAGVRLTLWGAAIGLLGAFGLARLLANVVPELPMQDPLTIGAVCVGLITVAVLACCLPAFRASRITPLVALRNE